MNLSDITGLLQQYTGGAAPAPDQAHQHFDQVAQAVPASTLSQGISAAFNSHETPSFGNMVSGLFTNGNSQQQAGILNSLLASAGPAVLGSLTSGGALSGLSSMLGSGKPLTPDQAAQVPPAAVQQIAEAAHKSDPSVVDQVSSVVANHPTLFKALGAVAAMVAIRKVAEKVG